MVAVNESWLRLGEGEADLMARDYSLYEIDKADGRTGGGAPILVAEKYDAREGHKLYTTHIQAQEMNIATSGLRISVVGVPRIPGPTPVQD